MVLRARWNWTVTKPVSLLCQHGRRERPQQIWTRGLQGLGHGSLHRPKLLDHTIAQRNALEASLKSLGTSVPYGEEKNLILGPGLSEFQLRKSLASHMVK